MSCFFLRLALKVACSKVTDREEQPMTSTLETIYALLIDAEYQLELFGDLPSFSRRGTGFLACCPFHRDSWPTLIVAGDRPEYFCYACSARGDWLDFLMARYGLDFDQAVERLARAAGCSPAGLVEENAWRAERDRAVMLEAFMEACMAALWSEEGQEALHWLVSRGYATREIRGMGLGFFPGHEEWAAPSACGISLPTSTGAAMARGNEETLPGVLIPYRDASGRLMGLVCRELSGTGEGMPARDPYRAVATWDDMDRTPFLLHRCRGAAETLVVEGFFDTLLVDQVRLIPVVGIGRGGDAVRMLDKAVLFGCRSFTLVPGASREGLARAAETARAMAEGGLDVHVMELPKGYGDLDEFIRKTCLDRFGALLKGRKRAGEWLERVGPHVSGTTPRQRGGH